MLRLEGQGQFALAVDTAQGLLDGLGRADQRLVAAVEQDGDAAAALLGFVKRVVGALQQARGIVVVGRAFGKADRGREVSHLGIQRVGFGQRRAQGVAPGAQFLFVEAGQDHGEFVAAQARHAGLRATGVFQAPGDLDQDFVAAIVAVDVVDRLEAVEIDQAQKERRGARQVAVQRVEEGAAVGQAGQGVEGGQGQGLVAVDVGGDAGAHGLGHGGADARGQADGDDQGGEGDPQAVGELGRIEMPGGDQHAGDRHQAGGVDDARPHARDGEGRHDQYQVHQLDRLVLRGDVEQGVADERQADDMAGDFETGQRGFAAVIGPETDAQAKRGQRDEGHDPRIARDAVEQGVDQEEETGEHQEVAHAGAHGPGIDRADGRLLRRAFSRRRGVTS